MSWSDQLHGESLMTVPGDDEFSNFLEFGMDFSRLNEHGQSSQHPSLPGTVPGSASEVEMQTEQTDQPSQFNRMMADFTMDLQTHSQGQNQRQAQGQCQDQDQGQAHQAYGNADIAPGFYSHDHSQQNHQPRQPFHQELTSQPYVYGHPIIPPTPNSIELHGGAARYQPRVDEASDIYDQYSRINEEQALYTPLVSPAMTPLETQLRFPEYTVPGEYLTPLTSPALEAQGPNHNSYPFPSRQISDMGFVQTPSDTSGIPGTSAQSSPGIVRKHRRRPSASTRFSGRAGKPSPSVRPQTRKKPLLHINSGEILNGLYQENGSKRPPSSGNSFRFSSNDSSGQDSVSPEPLSEPLMPPPALPQTRKSPALGPQAPSSHASEAATPATLMRIQSSQHKHDPTGQFRGQAQLVAGEPSDELMEDVVLPEAATPTTKLLTKNRNISTNVQTDASTYAASASGTPSLEPKSGTLNKAPGFVASSPCIGAMSPPLGPISKKSDSRNGTSRKRQSVSSSQISPPLQPKISPNIKPMLRSEGMSSEASALYLASKSNYQHILDGTLLPGVSYPETLAENLSSKRTNHKLAEQGRRNRINNALKEIEALLPPGFASAKLAKEAGSSSKVGEKEKAGNPMISKASTVEMAIDYIKELKRELKEAQEKLKATESKLGAAATVKTNEDSGHDPCPKQESTESERTKNVQDDLKNNDSASSSTGTASAIS